MTGNIYRGGCEKKLKLKNTIEVWKAKKWTIKKKSNYNKIEYCLGNGLELFSAPTVFAVCQDSSIFRTR